MTYESFVFIIRPHRIHDSMFSRLRPAKTAEWIEFLFKIKTLGTKGTLH